jgi:hypothetical protein
MSLRTFLSGVSRLTLGSIATALLGLSALAIAATGGANSTGLYIYGTPAPGCLVRLKEPLKQGEYIRWSGACKEEYASGVGTITYFDSTGKALSASRGAMQQGVQTGQWVAATPESGSPVGSSIGSNTPSASSTCNSNLRHLSVRIPNFTDPNISQLRTMLLETDIRQTIAAAKQQGYGPNQAVDASLQQARENDRVARQGAECASDVDAWGTTDEAFYQAISAGRIDRNIICQGIRNSCLCAAIINKMAAVGTRAIAAEMQCYIKNNRW